MHGLDDLDAMAWRVMYDTDMEQHPHTATPPPSRIWKKRKSQAPSYALQLCSFAQG